MAPATFAGARPEVRRGRPPAWDRDTIIQAIQEWVALYDEPPRAADWNPSSAKWSGQPWRVERYRAGRPDGTPWPALNAAKRPFGGSLVAAVRAAGFEPAKPGPKRRRDVDLAQADRTIDRPEVRALLDDAVARARDAERKVEALEARLDRAAARAAEVARRKPEVKTKTKVVRERVIDAAATARAVRRADAARAKADAEVVEAREAVATARMDAAEARGVAQRLAARLERAEATIATLREDRRELRADLTTAVDRVTALERLLDEARAQATESVAAPVVVREVEASPDAEAVRVARAQAERALRSEQAAQERAARAERELRETVAAIRGEARALSPAELAALRDEGPSGPAVLGQALTGLAAARRSGSPAQLRASLIAVARAAVTWQERI